MNCAEKRLYQKKPLSPGCRCVVFVAISSFFLSPNRINNNFEIFIFIFDQPFEGTASRSSLLNTCK